MNCQRGMNQRHHSAILTDHAWKRWNERSTIKVKRSKLVGLLQVKLNNALTFGLRLDKTGAGKLEIYPGLCATVRITDHGWLVATFKNGGGLSGLD